MSELLWSGVFSLSLRWVALTGMPDANYLATQATRHGMPAEVAWAVAWQETRRNTNPAVRGAHGEWGRFQIKPSTARARCPAHLDIRTYHGNVACGLRMLTLDYRRTGSWATAIQLHNGRGPMARQYQEQVLARVAIFQLRQRHE